MCTLFALVFFLSIVLRKTVTSSVEIRGWFHLKDGKSCANLAFTEKVPHSNSAVSMALVMQYKYFPVPDAERSQRFEYLHSCHHRGKALRCVLWKPELWRARALQAAAILALSRRRQLCRLQKRWVAPVFWHSPGNTDRYNSTQQVFFES